MPTVPPSVWCHCSVWKGLSSSETLRLQLNRLRLGFFLCVSSSLFLTICSATPATIQWLRSKGSLPTAPCARRPSPRDMLPHPPSPCACACARTHARTHTHAHTHTRTHTHTHEGLCQLLSSFIWRLAWSSSQCYCMSKTIGRMVILFSSWKSSFET